jgi:NAD(P)H-dependent FMN reductase
MNSLIGLSGSLRRGSYNSALLRAAAGLVPGGSALDIASIRDIPLYDGDLEAEHGIPEPVTALKGRIAAADGLLLATPEYNGSLPGVLKNAIDWLTRPALDTARVFGGKAVGVIGATPGRMGTALAQAAWLPVLRALGTRPFFGETLYVSGAGKLFDADGQITDAALRERLRGYVEAFAAFAAREWRDA